MTIFLSELVLHCTERDLLNCAKLLAPEWFVPTDPDSPHDLCQELFQHLRVTERDQDLIGANFTPKLQYDFIPEMAGRCVRTVNWSDRTNANIVIPAAIFLATAITRSTAGGYSGTYGSLSTLAALSVNFEMRTLRNFEHWLNWMQLVKVRTRGGESTRRDFQIVRSMIRVLIAAKVLDMMGVQEYLRSRQEWHHAPDIDNYTILFTHIRSVMPIECKPST